MAVTLHAPAKLNLCLSVGSPQPPRGYHPIASWMTALTFGDTLRLDAITDPGQAEPTFDLRFADDAPVPQPVDWPLDKDLGYRAYRAVCETVDRELPVIVELVKRVPAGAGLGGGSADAAAMIFGLDRLFDLQLDPAAMLDLAATLGCDVPFALRAILGTPSALASGWGDELEPLPGREPQPIALLFPPFGCATAPVYAAFDDVCPADRPAEFERVKRLAEHDPIPAPQLFNDLWPAAASVAPDLAGLRRAAAESLGLPVHMSGSGSTLFVLPESVGAATAAAATARDRLGLAAVATQTLG